MLNGTSLSSIQGGVRWDKLRSRETFKRQGGSRGSLPVDVHTYRTGNMWDGRMSKYKNGNEIRARTRRTRGTKEGSPKQAQNEAVFVWTLANPTNADKESLPGALVGWQIFDEVGAIAGSELVPEILFSKKVLACVESFPF